MIPAYIADLLMSLGMQLIPHELLNMLGRIVQKQICADVNKAGLYSILADETKDCMTNGPSVEICQC